MAKLTKLTHDRLTALLDFHPETGWLTWKGGHSNRMKDGDRAGAKGGEDRRYRFIALDGEKFLAHRLVWFYVYKEWPKHDVRPINGDFDDCRVENLKDIPRIELAHQRSAPKTNSSGFLGVSPSAKSGKWQASITWNYKQISLGSNFETAEEASQTYSDAVEQLKSASSSEEVAIVVAGVKRLRRQRSTWKYIQRIHPDHGWASFYEFCSTVVDFPRMKYAMVAIDTAKAIGPDNFRWALPLDTEHSTRDGHVAYNRANIAANKDHYRHKHLKKTYGANFAYERKLLVEQNGLCAICQKPEEITRGHKARRLSLDHNHATGALRGLLCGNCNMALGYFCDDPEILRKAIAYLDKHKNGTPNVIPLKKTEDTA